MLIYILIKKHILKFGIFRNNYNFFQSNYNKYESYLLIQIKFFYK